MNELSPLPQPFLDKLTSFLSAHQITEVLSALEKPLVTAFRVNTLFASPEKTILQLEKEGFSFEPVRWYRDAFLLKNKTKQELLKTSSAKKGEIYIQGLSSMIPAIVLDPKHGETVLDMAAAPGSKTTQLAAYMQNTGELTANDKSRERLYKLKMLLENQGVTNTKVINVSGEYLWKKLPEYFDRVLLDAPCSMEGRFTAHDKKSFEDWSPKKVKLLSKIQKYLLRSAVSCTKVGGTIVYSTCTLSPEENEEVVDWILKKEQGKVMLDKITLEGLISMPGLTSWKKRVFDSTLSYSLRILPSGTMEGFYIAKFIKVASNLSGVEMGK